VLHCRLNAKETFLKVAITGAAGLFGHGLVETFRGRHEVISVTRAEADITNEQQVQSLLARHRPHVVIHSAAMPDLDLCEAEPERAERVNVGGTRHVAAAAERVGAKVALISTDAVFDGEKREPYTESDPTNPPTVYGKTKLQAERIVRERPDHWVFRISVLFGPGKTNFVEKGLRAIASGQNYVAAEDQLGSATYTIDAAAKIMEVLEAERYGLFHLSNLGACTRVELARRAASLARVDPNRVIGRLAALMGRRAKRLSYAVMEMEALRRAGFALPRPWQDALADYVTSLNTPHN
jgi:dTDP-4-dehydrorhamnose reductase